MEVLILKILDWNVFIPTTCDFLNIYLVGDENKDILKLTYYISDLILHEYKILKYKPSIISMSCYILALTFYNKPYWNKEMEYITKNTYLDIYPCLKYIFKIFKREIGTIETQNHLKPKRLHIDKPFNSINLNLISI
jgi:hypothetical protein